MSQINPNISSQYNMHPESQYSKTNQKVSLPSYYVVPENKMTFEDSIQDNFLAKMAYEMTLKPFMEHPIALLTSWLGISYGLDSYAKACGGDYEKSLTYKAAHLGDNIQNSKVIQNKPVQYIIKGLNSSKKSIGKLTEKSAILRSMKQTPTMPELDIVKTQMFNQKQEVVQEFIRICDTLKLNSSGSAKLKDLGPTKSELKMLKETFHCNKISQISEDKAVNQILLHRLGKTPKEINTIQRLGGVSSTEAVKKEILNLMGLNKEKLTLIKEDTLGKYIDDVEKAAGKVKGKVKVGAGHFKFLGPLTKPFERSFGCDSIYNKLHSMSSGAKTGTGRFMSRAMQVLHRGLTFGNGKIGALLFITPFLLDTAINTYKADKDQKIGTAANGLVNNISWVFTFPIALKIIHAIGGIKYAGMGKKEVAEYRKLVDDFNNKVKTSIMENGQEMPNKQAFKTKAEYDLAKKETQKKLKALTKVPKQNIFTKTLRKITGFLTNDLGRMKSYRNSTFLSNILRRIPQGLRNVGSVPLRFIGWGALTMGLDSLLSKGVKSIFGEYYDSMKTEERKDKLKQQKKFLHDDLNRRLYEAQKNKQYGAYNVENKVNAQANIISSKGKMADNPYIQTTDNNINSQISNSEEKIKENEIDNYTYIPSQQNFITKNKKENKVDNYTYIPSQQNIIKSNNNTTNNKRTYIPSQNAANITKHYDNSKLQSAFDRAQQAEDRALKVLAGNFDGM